jgi:DNA-binding NtrC family response regulator
MENLQKTHKKNRDVKTQMNKTKQILLIGEDKDAILSMIIEQEGYHLVRCNSVHQAWNLVYPHRPHFIILRLDNFERTALSDFQECRALAEGVPIIVMTPTCVSRALMKALQHRAVIVVATSSAAQSVREALHGLEGPQ